MKANIFSYSSKIKHSFIMYNKSSVAPYPSAWAQHTLQSNTKYTPQWVTLLQTALIGSTRHIFGL